MKNSRNKILTIFLILAMLFVLAIPAFASTEIQTKKIETPNDYIMWFEKEIEKNENIEQKDALKQFKQLSKEQQNKFISYLNNEELLKEVIDAFNNNESKTMYDGDIVIEVEMTELVVQKEDMMQFSELLQANYKKWVTFLGVNIFEVTAWVRYNHDGEKVTSILGSNHLVSRNYNPLLDHSWSEITRWGVGTSTAHSSRDITFSILWEGLGIIINSAESRVWGNYNNSGGWLEEI